MADPTPPIVSETSASISHFSGCRIKTLLGGNGEEFN